MTNDSSRNNQDDLIRIVAMIFVMIFHSGFVLENNLIISTFVLPCNSLFFMLSGKYSLRLTFNEKKDYFRFYIKKFINLFVPLFIFSVLFFVYSHLHTNESIQTLLIWFGYGFLGDTINGVYWFPYVLLGLMLSTPFLCKLVQNLSDFELKLLFVISFFWQLVSVMLVQDLLNATTNIFA